MGKKVVLLKSRIAKLGGLEKQTLRIAQAFLEKGCEVTILTNGEESSKLSIPTVHLGPAAKWSALQLSQFHNQCQEWLRKNSADLIFGVERTPGVTHYRAGNGVHAAYLHQRQYTDSWLKQLSFRWNPLHRKILDYEKQIFESDLLKTLIVNSHMVQNEIQQYYNVPNEKLHVIHNGVEWKEFEKPFSEWESVKSKNEPYHFLFIGNGYQRKGLPQLLEALSYLKSEKFQLIVIGKDKNQKLFEEMASKLGIADKVRFLGQQSNILSYYQQADALVIPSLYDPFANVTVEALAMGLYVISSKFNGGSEVLTPETGVVIEDVMSPESFSMTLKDAMNHPKTEESAVKIRNSVQHLTFENQLNKLVTVSTMV